MSGGFEVKTSERGIVRLFLIDLPDDALIDAFTDSDTVPWPLQQALGAETLDPDHVESFALRDLEGLGLSGYMAEGLGIREDEIAADRTRLDALDGHLLVVTSPAFRAQAQVIRPRAPLRWVGTYTEDRAPVSFTPLPDAAATGPLSGPTAAPAPANPYPRLALWLGAALLVGLGLLALGLGVRG